MWNKREKTVLRMAAVGCIAIIAGLVIGIKSAKGEESLLPDRVVERECMAEAILFEAGNQPIVGKLAVAEVILNRVRSDKYPNTICGVLRQPLNSLLMVRRRKDDRLSTRLLGRQRRLYGQLH